MTAKETFLSTLVSEIKEGEATLKTLKDAYEANKVLPDSYFDRLFPNGFQGIDEPLVLNGDAETEFTLTPQADESSDYGRNRKVVLTILRETNKALLKNEIVKFFEAKTGEDNQESAVTNVIAALSMPSTGILKGYKPKDGVKFRGKYWTLASWWKDGELIEAHKPDPYDPWKKYA